jgi:hypothetical protein
MAVSATAKSLINSDSYSTKWHQKRIHRKLDDRDDVLDEALQIIEEHDPSAFPHISNVACNVASGSTGYNDISETGGTFILTFTVGGAGCTAASTITCVVGSQAATLVTPGANTVACTIPDMADWAVSPAADTLVPVYLRVDGVLCPVMTLPPTVA